jgi:Fe-Mn family superoxide dismutase
MFTLPDLLYWYDALEPVIDTQTMLIHHTKHHQAYIDKLNAGLNGTWYEWLTLEELFAQIDNMDIALAKIIKNHGGWHYNHTIFWKLMTPWWSAPSSSINKIISDNFGSFDLFQTQFITVATNHFGSWWARLIDNGTTLEIVSTSNQENPLMSGKKILLWVDIWEHAYYLAYQNRRADYLNARFNIINWNYVEELYHTT